MSSRFPMPPLRRRDHPPINGLAKVYLGGPSAVPIEIEGEIVLDADLPRPPAGLRRLPPSARLSPYPPGPADLSGPVTVRSEGRTPHHLALPDRPVHSTSLGQRGPARPAPRARNRRENRSRSGDNEVTQRARPFGGSPDVGAGVRPSGGVGVGLHTDPHTDPTVRLSVQVSRYAAATVMCCDRPSSGVSPGGDAHPYQL
jgi:hypothetical protein